MVQSLGAGADWAIRPFASAREAGDDGSYVGMVVGYMHRIYFQFGLPAGSHCLSSVSQEPKEVESTERYRGLA
jgi:hypothetical protein